MANNKLQTFGPVALTTTYTTNVIAPAAAGASGVGYTATGTYIVIRHIRIVNKTGSAATFRLFVGTTGGNSAGTEFMGYDTSVAANSYVDWYGQLRLEGSGGFLVGGAGTATALTLIAEGEVGLV